MTLKNLPVLWKVRKKKSDGLRKDQEGPCAECSSGEIPAESDSRFTL